jgi:hypothetical protein
MTTELETGGTYFITSYHLQMSVAGVWSDVVGGSSAFTSTSYTVTGLVEGNNYGFRVRASNSFGWGSFSDVVTISADDVPS